MFRAILPRVISTEARLQKSPIRWKATAPPLAKAPEKIEVFVDDIPVMVYPGTTVLQVIHLKILI